MNYSPLTVAFYYCLVAIIGIASFCTTILGWIAVAQIRRSAGKLYGMGLAVFDGLLFPLLALNFLIGWLVLEILFVAHSLFARNQQGSPGTIGVFILSLPIIIPLNLYIIRSVWRAVNKSAGASPRPAEQVTSNKSVATPQASGLGNLAFGLFLVGFLGTPLLLVFHSTLENPAVIFGGLALLVALVLGVMSWRERLGKFVVIATGILLAGFTVISVVNYFAMRSEMSSQMKSLERKEREHMQAMSARDKTTRPAENSPPPALSTGINTLTFGPVMERVLEARQSGTNAFLDLDTGRLLTPPREVIDALAATEPNSERAWQALDIPEDSRPFRYIQWLRESGVDLMFAGDGKVIGFDCAFPLAHGNTSTNWESWDDLTPADVRKAVGVIEWGRKVRDAKRGNQPWPEAPKEGGIVNQAQQLDSKNPGGPLVNLLTLKQSAIWFFKTREGGMGIMQITGFTENPRGVKIRYKLVQSAGGNTVPAPKPAAQGEGKPGHPEHAEKDAEQDLLGGTPKYFLRGQPAQHDKIWQTILKRDYGVELVLLGCVPVPPVLEHATRYNGIVLPKLKGKHGEEFLKISEEKAKAESEAATVTAPKFTKVESILIAADGALTVEGEPCPVDQLPAKLGALAARHPVMVQIRAHPHAALTRVTAVIKACDSAGIIYKAEQGVAAKADPIGKLTQKLDETQGEWLNGLNQELGLPPTATSDEVLLKIIAANHLGTNIRIQELRKDWPIRGFDPSGDHFTAVLVEVDAGKRIILFRRDGDSWWSRVFELP